MVEAIIFDVDGTLIDSVDAHARSWTETFAEFGHDIPFEKVRYQIGKGGDQLMAEFLSEEEIRTWGKAIEDARKKRFMKDYLPSVKGFPQTRELFAALAADGYRLALASSAEGEELKHYKEKAGITDLVEDETSKSDAEKSKPHPDIFDAAADKLEGLDKEEMLIVGDSPWDAIAAKRAGIRAVAVLCGGFPEDDLREAGFLRVYRDPAELLQRREDFCRL